MSSTSHILSSENRCSVRSNNGISRYWVRCSFHLAGNTSPSRYLSQYFCMVAAEISSLGCASHLRAVMSMHTACEASSRKASSDTRGKSEFSIKYAARSCIVRLFLTRMAILLQGTPLRVSSTTVANVISFIRVSASSLLTNCTMICPCGISWFAGTFWHTSL